MAAAVRVTASHREAMRQERRWKAETRRLARRRAVFFCLGTVTTLLLMAAMGFMLKVDGIDGLDLALLGCFLLMLPWNVINFWNAVVGLALLVRERDPLRSVFPGAARARRRVNRPLHGRTAIVVPIFEEDPHRVLRHVEATRRSLEASGDVHGIEIFILSDTQVSELACAEEKLFAACRSGAASSVPVHYRRRATNEGAKVANIAEFVDRVGDRFDYLLVLDADSLMTGEAIRRLLRLMETDPRLGIVQTLVVGLPSESGFARLFQYGMRHGMRIFALGAAWWQGRSGCYWGHNALIRLAPFRAHCRLPVLPGKPPFGGRILSHDQVEAILMRRAGYAVRVLPVEGGSFEENPPTLPDFVKRDLRWCQGNLQYGPLLLWPRLSPMSRLQLLLAMLMYLQAPAWLGFVWLSLLRPLFAMHLPAVSAPLADGPAVHAVGLGLFLTVMAMVLTPKAAGFLAILGNAADRRAYGGAIPVMLSGMIEFLFSVLLVPVLATLQSLFIVGLFFGHARIWSSQHRALHRVSFGQSCRFLWPVVLMGGTLAAMACLSAPAAVPYLFPVAVPMMLAPLLTWFSARPGCGAWLVRYGIVATPEELNPPAEVVMAGHDVRASSAGAAREPAAGSLGRGGAGIDALTPVGQ